MAEITTFKAVVPDSDWFNSVLEGVDGGLGKFKYVLEARGMEGIGTGHLGIVQAELLRLIEEGNLNAQESEALYIYQQESSTGIRRGVWAMTSVQDYVNGNIIGHEETLGDREDRIYQYRGAVGLEGSPVLLTYRPQPAIQKIINELVLGESCAVVSHESTIHSIWKVEKPEMVSALISLFKTIQYTYICDGHHRLAAAKRMNQISPQWVMSLYVDTSSLEISSFDRLISCGQELDSDKLIADLQKLFFISPVPQNVPYIPTQIHRLGMMLNGAWYQLDLKPVLYDLMQLADVAILQDQILMPLLGISDPRSSEKLMCYPRSSFQEMHQMAQDNDGTIIFTLSPLSVHKLLAHSGLATALPPKSSFIGPKIPYGLLLNAPSLSVSFIPKVI